MHGLAIRLNNDTQILAKRINSNKTMPEIKSANMMTIAPKLKCVNVVKTWPEPINQWLVTESA